MNRGRVEDERGGKETDRCPLTVSKVMGWGMISKMIRDKNVTWGTRVETVTGGTD
jgi:hypothetical protein